MSMDPSSESPLNRAQIYRAARRSFIAACEAAGVDAIARLHPAKAADGKPLFMDAAALGPRLADKAVLAICSDADGSAILSGLLHQGFKPPAATRLVIVHSLDPARFAGAACDPTWVPKMLGAVVSEDLSRVRELGVLQIGRQRDLAAVLAARLVKAKIAMLPPAAHIDQAQETISAFLAQ
jgi:hypothetical protein